METIYKNSKSVTALAKQKLMLEEGDNVSRSEIINYIYINVGVDFFTDGMIARGISDIEKDREYVKVERGVYKKLSKNEKEGAFRIEANRILEETCNKLENVISKSDNYVKNDIDKASSYLSELEEILKTTKYINNMIDIIKKSIV